MQLHPESLESRIALSINVYATPGGVDGYLGSAYPTIDGSVVAASDNGDDLFIQQVASVEDPSRNGPTTQDLLIADNASFLEYQNVDGIDSLSDAGTPNYRHIFVTNGTGRSEDLIRSDFQFGGSELNGGARFETRFLVNCEEVGWVTVFLGDVYRGVGGSISYVQADGVTTTWNWKASSSQGALDVVAGSQFTLVAGSPPIKNDYIVPVNGSWDSMYPGGDPDNLQAYLDVTWSGITNPNRPPWIILDQSSAPPHVANPATGYFPSWVKGVVPDLDGSNNIDPTLKLFPAEAYGTKIDHAGGLHISTANSTPSFATTTFALPGAFASTSDGAGNKKSLGVMPATLRGESGSITIVWSDGIAYPLAGFDALGLPIRPVGFRTDAYGIMRFDTLKKNAYLDSAAFIQPAGMGVIRVVGSVDPSGIVTLEFRRFNTLTLGGAAFNFTGAVAIQGIPGPVTIHSVDRATPTGVVREPIQYATFTRDPIANEVTFPAGQTITRQVTVDLLTSGSSLWIDSPIEVADFANQSGDPKGSLDFRVTNIDVRATMTAPHRLMVGHSTNSKRDRLTLLPPYDQYSDYDNPFQVTPNMPQLYKDRGGFPIPRTPQLLAEVKDGRVVALIPTPGFEGSGYDPDNPPVITIAPPAVSGTQATAIAEVGSNGALIGYRITNSGSGYDVFPTSGPDHVRPMVTVTAAIPARQALARVAEINAASGTVDRVIILDPGYGYQSPPIVEVEAPPAGPDNIQATAQARLDSEGRVIAIEVVDPGRGYVSRPVVTLSSPSQVAYTESMKVSARIEANIYEMYVTDDFGTPEPRRGKLAIAPNATLSTTPIDVILNGLGAPLGDGSQTVVVSFPAPTFLPPAGFNPVGALITGFGIRPGTRIVGWDAINRLMTLPAGSIGLSTTFPQTATVIVRADSLYLEAESTDVYQEGLVNVTSQSYLLQSRSKDRGLAPFVFTTASPITGIQTGTVEGVSVAFTLGNDAATPLQGSTAYQHVDIQTQVASLRVKAAESNADPAGAFPYDLTIREFGSISIDALAASSRPIAISALGNITFTSAVATDSDLTINAEGATTDVYTSFSVTSPVSSKYGTIAISADSVEVRNSLSVTAAAFFPSRQDIVLEARRGRLFLQGAINAVNDVLLDQAGKPVEGDATALEGNIEGSRSRVRAEQLVVRSTGAVNVRTDVTSLRGQAIKGFEISELNDITIPLLSSGGIVKLEALGVDSGARGANPIALSARLLDVTNLVVNTPNGTSRIDANTNQQLVLGDATDIYLKGSRATGMRAAGDVTVRSQAGDVVALDLPIAGGSARTVRVASEVPLPATTTFTPGVPGSSPSTLSGIGQINRLGTIAGRPFWGRDDRSVSIALAVGDRVLIKDQVVARENGVYVVTKVGGGILGSPRWELSRAADSDTAVEMQPGTVVRVLDGTYYDRVFSIAYDVVPQTLVQRIGVNALQMPDTFSYYSMLKVGQMVAGAGIAPNSYISSIDSITGVVMLDVMNPGAVYTQQPVSAVEVSPTSDPDTVKLAGSFSGYEDLAIGQGVFGAGVQGGARITGIDTVNQTLTLTPGSLPKPSPKAVDVTPVPPGGAPYVSTLPLQVTPAELSEARLGQRIHVYDANNAIITVATIKAVSIAGLSVTLSTPLPAGSTPVSVRLMPVPSLTFASPPATSVTWQEALPDQLQLDPAFTNYPRLSPGQLVLGAGIAPGTVIHEIDAINRTITVSPRGQGVLPVDLMDRPVRRSTSTTIGFNTGDIDLGKIRIGQVVELYTAADVKIDSIPVAGVNMQTRTVALARAIPSGAIPATADFRSATSISFGAGGAGSVPVAWNFWSARNDTVGKPNVITLPNFTDFTGLTIGQRVYGLEIPQGTTIAGSPGSIDAASRSITVTVDDLQTPVTWSANNPDVILLPADFSRYQDLALGRLLRGPGVLPGASITGYDSISGSVTVTPGALPLAIGPADVIGTSADTLTLDLTGGFTAANLSNVHVGQRAALRDGANDLLGVLIVTATDLVNGIVTFDSGIPAGGATRVEFLPLGVHFPEIEGTSVANDVSIEVRILPNTLSNVRFGPGATALQPAPDCLVLPTTFVNYGSLFVGQTVYGAGINPGAVITKIDVANRSISLTPKAIAPGHELLGVAVADNQSSPWYPSGFDDWAELDPSFNDFTEIHIGQRVEFHDAQNKRLGVATVTGVDGAYRTIGFSDGALDGIVSDVVKVSFLPVTEVRFGVIEGVGAAFVDFSMPAIGRTAITVSERAVVTNVGSDGLGKSVSFVVSTNGTTNAATGSLGKLIAAYEINDTSTTELDLPVLGVQYTEGQPVVLSIDPLFTAYDRILAGQLGVRGTSRMFTSSATVVGLDPSACTITLAAGSLTELAITDTSRIQFVTIPALTVNPDQTLDFRFWAYSLDGTRTINLTQELTQITRPILLDGTRLSTAGNIILDPPSSPRGVTGIPVIDGQRITSNRRGRLVATADRINGLSVCGRYDANGVMQRSADGTKIARLSIGGFSRGDAIGLEGVRNVVVDTVRAGATPTTNRLPNNASIRVTSARNADGTTRRLAENNTILNSSVVAGLSAGIAIEGGAERTYVVGTTVGSPSVDNQVGIFLNSDDNFIGVNDIAPATRLASSTQLEAGSKVIRLTSGLFKFPLIGLGVVAVGLPAGTVITGIDSTTGVAYLSKAAKVTRSTQVAIGHLGQRLQTGPDESPLTNTVRLYDSVPLDEVFVGQAITGDGVPSGAVIAGIDRGQRLITLSANFTTTGTGLVFFGSPGRNTVQNNRTGVVLRGSGNRIANTSVINNTLDGVDVATAGNTIGSQAYVGEVGGVGGMAMTSWGVAVTAQAGARSLTLPSTFRGGSAIRVGTLVYGPGIPFGTMITSITPPTSRVKVWGLGLSDALQSNVANAVVSFGVTNQDDEPLRLTISSRDVANLFVGQGVHGVGLPEFLKIEAISAVDGLNGYIRITPPDSTNAGAQNFALPPSALVFSELSTTSNEFWGNGNYGIRIRHPAPFAAGGTVIARNFMNLTRAGSSAVSNRLGSTFFAQYSGQPRMPAEYRENTTEKIDGFGNKYPGGGTGGTSTGPTGGGTTNWPPPRRPTV